MSTTYTCISPLQWQTEISAAACLPVLHSSQHTDITTHHASCSSGQIGVVCDPVKKWHRGVMGIRAVRACIGPRTMRANALTPQHERHRSPLCPLRRRQGRAKSHKRARRWLHELLSGCAVRRAKDPRAGPSTVRDVLRTRGLPCRILRRRLEATQLVCPRPAAHLRTPAVLGPATALLARTQLLATCAHPHAVSAVYRHEDAVNTFLAAWAALAHRRVAEPTFRSRSSYATRHTLPPLPLSPTRALIAVQGVYIVPAYRRRGIASALVRTLTRHYLGVRPAGYGQVLEIVPEGGAKEAVCINVADEGAKRIYRREGYLFPEYGEDDGTRGGVDPVSGGRG
ncbi:hypothetical protein BD413DRAFT_563908 [Trametes elegans]|nr:hypothetical protein BD413DRAFT_563908 [Trametes elegans]